MKKRTTAALLVVLLAAGCSNGYSHTDGSHADLCASYHELYKQEVQTYGYWSDETQNTITDARNDGCVP